VILESRRIALICFYFNAYEIYLEASILSNVGLCNILFAVFFLSWNWSYMFPLLSRFFRNAQISQNKTFKENFTKHIMGGSS